MIEIPSKDIKAAAHRLIDALPQDATWDDVLYRMYVQQTLEAGIADADAGKVISVEEVRRRFGLTP